MDSRTANADADAAQRLTDQQEIADLCVRYTIALDTKDWALLESCFAPSPVFVHPGGRLEGFPAILERTKAALTPLTATQHLLGNIVVTVDGDTARSMCYFQAQHVRAGTPGGETYIIARQLRRRTHPRCWRLEDHRAGPGLHLAGRQPCRRRALRRQRVFRPASCTISASISKKRWLRSPMTSPPASTTSTAPLVQLDSSDAR